MTIRLQNPRRQFAALLETFSDIPFSPRDQAIALRSFMRYENEVALVQFPLKKLYIAKVGGFLQRSQRIARGNKFVRDVAFVACFGDAAHHAVPLYFLRAVQFVPAGHAAGVEVAHPLNIFLNGGDQIAFHDLHVINVVEQFDARRIDCLHHFQAPLRVSHM